MALAVSCTVAQYEDVFRIARLEDCVFACLHACLPLANNLMGHDPCWPYGSATHMGAVVACLI